MAILDPRSCAAARGAQARSEEQAKAGEAKSGIYSHWRNFGREWLQNWALVRLLLIRPIRIRLGTGLWARKAVRLEKLSIVRTLPHASNRVNRFGIGRADGRVRPGGGSGAHPAQPPSGKHRESQNTHEYNT